MQILLDLSRHCIQTECRRAYERAVSAYFRADDGPDKSEIENKIDLLHTALSTLDFGFLRSGFPELSGNTGSHVELGRGGNGQIIIFINGEMVHAAQP